MTGSRQPQAETARLILAVVDRCREADLPICVPRNYEQLPERPRGDLDLLVGPGDGERLVEIILGRARDHGWRRFLHRTDQNHEHLIFWHPSPGHATVHFDVQRSLGRKGFHYAASEPFLRNRESFRGIPIAAAPARALALGLHVVLDKGRVEGRYRHAVERDLDGRTDALAREVLNGRAADSLVRWLRAGLPDRELAAVARRLRSALRRRYPLNAVRPTWSRLRNRMRLFGPRRGVLVAAVGPNGAGKSTALEAVARLLPSDPPPLQIAYMGKRDVFLPTSRLVRRFHRKEIEAGSPASRPPKPPTPVRRAKDLLGLVNWAVEQWARYWTHVRPYLQQDGVVLVDRYSYDISGREPWSVVHLGWFTRLYRRLFAVPDRTYLFWASPEVLWERKREDTPEAARRTIEELRRILEDVPNATEVCTEGPLPEIASKIAAEIVAVAEARRTP